MDFVIKQVAVLESELEEKDTQLLTLTSQLRQMENKLETTQQQLTLQKDANSLLHMQVERWYLCVCLCMFSFTFLSMKMKSVHMFL